MNRIFEGIHGNVHIFRLNNGQELVLKKSTIRDIDDIFIIVELNQNNFISINKNNLVYHEQISLEQYEDREKTEKIMLKEYLKIVNETSLPSSEKTKIVIDEMSKSLAKEIISLFGKVIMLNITTVE